MIHKPVSDRVETNVCIEFEALFDIPFGIMRTIRDKFNDPSVFEQYWTQADTYTLRCLLYEREIYNPIYAAMKEDIKDRKYADKIYDDLHSEDFYNVVLNNSPPINMYNIVSAMDGVRKANGEMLYYTVICKNNIQADFLISKLPNIEYKITSKPFDFDVSTYNLIILERYENIIRYCKKRMVQGKVIWIPEFWYNMDTKDRTIPSMEISIFCGDVNIVQVYEPYNNFNKPLG